MPPENGKLKLFNPLHPYMRKNVKNFEAVSMLEPVFVNGELVYECRSSKRFALS